MKEQKDTSMNMSDDTQQNISQQNLDNNNKYNKECCYCDHFCCCCDIKLITATKIIAIWDIVVWTAMTINFMCTLPYSGGSNWMPGHIGKYIATFSLLGCSLNALGAITTYRSNFSKKFIGEFFIYMKIAYIFLLQIGNIIALAVQPSVLNQNTGIGYEIFGILVWIFLDVYFLFILRSYSKQQEPIGNNDLYAPNRVPQYYPQQQQLSYYPQPPIQNIERTLPIPSQAYNQPTSYFTPNAMPVGIPVAPAPLPNQADVNMPPPKNL